MTMIMYSIKILLTASSDSTCFKRFCLDYRQNPAVLIPAYHSGSPTKRLDRHLSNQFNQTDNYVFTAQTTF